MNEVKVNENDTSWGVFCHLAALLGWVFPFGNILGPFVIWMIKKDSDPFVDDQGKESMNFQISVTIYSIVSLLLFVMSIFVFPLMFLVIAFMGLLFVGSLICVIVAAIKASQGERFRYPFTMRLIK